eukprot:279316_1
MSTIENALQEVGLKLVNIYNGDALYSCFAEEIYGDVLEKHHVKKECEEYMIANRSLTETVLKSDESNIAVTIQTAQGESYDLSISKQITIKQLKDKIRDVLPSMEPQKLIHCGKVICDENTIESVDTKHQNSLVLNELNGMDNSHILCQNLNVIG